MRISREGNLVTLINVFETTPEQQQELIDQWIRFVEEVTGEPGIIGAALHKSTDGTRVVSPVAQNLQPSWTSGVLAALDQSSLPAFLPYSGRLSHQVPSQRAHGLERAPSGPATAPPLSRVCSLADGPGLRKLGVPPQAFPIQDVPGQGVYSIVLRRPHSGMDKRENLSALVHAFYSIASGAVSQAFGIVVNYAQWRSEEDFKSFVKKYREQMDARRPAASRVDPHLFEVVYLFERRGS